MLQKGNSNRGVGKIKVKARDTEEGKTREWILRDFYFIFL